MDLTVALCVSVQIALIAYLIFHLRAEALGKLGFLFVLISFVYHGLTEIAQAIFPGRDIYRFLVLSGSLDPWLIVITASMVLFTAGYRVKLRKYSRPFPLRTILSALSGAYLLKWPVLLAMGTSGLFLVILRQDSGATGSSVLGGLADQFTILLLALALATICLTVAPRRVLFVSGLFAVLLLLYGARTQVMLVILMGISTLIRYGMRLRLRTIIAVGSLVAVAFGLISVGRIGYGRFKGGEGVLQRFEILGTNAENNGFDLDGVLDDTVYRFDGNSFGAMVLAKQSDGYPITGFTQFLATISYIVPSFINRGKLDTEAYLRNEETYQDVFYEFPTDTDYISVFWSLLVGYVGWVGMLVLAPLLGWSMAVLDNWLAESATLTAYLTGVTLSFIPLSMEQGIAGIPYTLRGLLLLLIVAHTLNVGVRKAGGRRQIRRRVSLAHPETAS